MNLGDAPVSSGKSGAAAHTPVEQKTVYVLAGGGEPRPATDGVDILELVKIIWFAKWFIASVSAAFALASIAYALLATEWYRAEVLLAPADEKSTQGLAAQFGGLANLAGIKVGGGGTAEPIAVLKSREFAREFIDDLNLMTVLLSDEWDVDAQRWRSPNPESWPDIRDAVKMFDEKMRIVSENKQTGLVTLAVQWTDPVVAAEWANLLVERLNDRMRERALAEAEANVAYLQAEMSNTNVVAIQQSIGRLLETELQKLMLARGNAEFSFRVIDPAEPPKYRVSPKRTLIVLIGTLLGGLIAVFFVLVRHAIRHSVVDSPAAERARVAK